MKEKRVPARFTIRVTDDWNWETLPQVFEGPRGKSRAIVYADRLSSDYHAVAVHQEGGSLPGRVVFGRCRAHGDQPLSAPHGLTNDYLRIKDMTEMTRDEIVQHFGELTPDEIVTQILEIQAAGKAHGEAGYYPDGDFSSDADWCNGVGKTIRDLEELTGSDCGDVFEIYYQAHAEALANDPAINPDLRGAWPRWSVVLGNQHAFEVFGEDETAVLDALAEWLLDESPELVVKHGAEQGVDSSYDPEGEEGLKGYKGTLSGWLQVTSCKKQGSH